MSKYKKNVSVKKDEIRIDQNNGRPNSNYYTSMPKQVIHNPIAIAINHSFVLIFWLHYKRGVCILHLVPARNTQR